MKFNPGIFLAILIGCMYVASLFLVGFHTTIKIDSGMPNTPLRGIQILSTGWLGILDGTIGWYANPLLFLGVYWLLARKKEISLIAISLLGTVIALSSSSYKKMYVDEKYAQYLDVVDFEYGFYLWACCFLVLFFSSIFFYIKTRNINENAT